MSTEKILKVASFFAGVGGIDLGFEQAGFQVVYANEFDPYPAETYNLNFANQIDLKDIHDVKAYEIPDFDIMIGGFPCQAFSIAGYRQGFSDEKGRGELFFELTRIIREKALSGSPVPVVFFENVKNLTTHDYGQTFRVIRQELMDLGYTLQYQVINACQYGNIPQNRERIYIVGFQDIRMAERFVFPEPVSLTTSLEDCIDFHSQYEEKYYYKKDRCPFYEKLEEKVARTDTLYQWRRKYVRENKNGLCPTLTANMGQGGHNVPIILADHGIRKLTPRECYNLQGFPKDFRLANQADSRLYKAAGNSVCVPVIRRIAEQILKINKF